MEKENNKKKISILIGAIMVVVLLLIGFTYTYLSSNTREENSVKAGTLLISYEDDNLESINMSNIQPIYDKDIKEKASKINFQVNNTGTAKAYVDINITDISLPSELEDLEFKWALYSGEEKISNGNFRNVLDNKLLLTNNQEITSSKNYELYIWISENELDQSDMMEKTFSGKITVVGHQNKQTELLSKVIKDDNTLQKGNPDFSKIAVSQEYYDTLPESSTNDRDTSKSQAVVENGLYASEDDDGETYYFRGNVEDNYLKIEGLKWPSDLERLGMMQKSGEIEYDANNYCSWGYYDYYSSEEECIADIKEVGPISGEDMLFRIVRINGDGSIRIKADGSVGMSAFNDDYDYFSSSELEKKYVGYTYDNSKPNVQDGISSKIKNYLDNWYIEHMQAYDELLANTRYCNDTSISRVEYDGEFILYGAYSRLHDSKQPTYICPNTNETYGGEYDLKIGLLSADEVAFAGGVDYIENHNYYLYGNETWIRLGTPYGNNIGSYELFFKSDVGGIGVGTIYEQSSVSPVLNLRADILFEQGDGTKDNPYIVSLD